MSEQTGTYVTLAVPSVKKKKKKSAPFTLLVSFFLLLLLMHPPLPPTPTLFSVRVTRQLAISIKETRSIGAGLSSPSTSQKRTSGLIAYVMIDLSGHLAAYFATVRQLGPGRGH